MVDVSIIIVNWNTRDLLAQCVDAAYTSGTGLCLEIMVVDNGSTDGSLDMIRQRFPQVHLVSNAENVGFARANNQAVRLSEGRHLLLLNSDAFLQPGALSAMVALADDQAQAGLVGACLLNPDGSYQASYTAFPSLWREFLILSGIGRFLYGRHYPSHGPTEGLLPLPVDYVEGACLLVRREAYEAAGGLDEDYFMYAEEVDLAYVLRQTGWQVWYQPRAQVVHLGGASSRQRRPQREGDLYRSRVRFFRKHYGGLSAAALKSMIYGFTLIKIAMHGVLRWVSGGRWGRTVVPLQYLVTRLKGA